jgi:xylose isomerase
VTAWLDSVGSRGCYQISFDNPDKEPHTLKTENIRLYEIIKTNGLDDGGNATPTKLEHDIHNKKGSKRKGVLSSKK